MRLMSRLFGSQALLLIVFAGCNHCNRGYRNGYYPAPAPPAYPSGASTYASGPPAYSGGGATFAPEAEATPQSPPPAAGSGSRTAPMYQGSGSR